ncbi:MAG: Mg2+ and Co2+ transporter CorA [Halieaceae bacterium]|jgi:Mg2+ and Co2+ transporter CorA
MATVKKATAKKAPVKKATAKKAAPKKVAAKTTEFSLKNSAEKAVNVYLGVIGKGIDSIRENVESARKDNGKRVKELEKRGVKLRVAMNKRFDKIEMPEVLEIDEVVDDVKAQFNKIQDRVEGTVESVKEKLIPTKKAA